MTGTVAHETPEALVRVAYVRITAPPPKRSGGVPIRRTPRRPSWRCQLRIFTNLSVGEGGTPPPAIPGVEEPLVPGAIAGLPYRATETMDLHWRQEDYVAARSKTDRAAAKSLDAKAIFRTIPPILRSLLDGSATGAGHLRLWWQVSTPGMAHLPWEALPGLVGTADISFVRGSPAVPLMARLPIQRPIRLALIYQPPRTPEALIKELSRVTSLEITHMTQPPLEAIDAATRGGFHAVHIVADGSVSLADEAYLFVHKPGLIDARTTSRWAMKALVLATKVDPLVPGRVKAWLGSKLGAQLGYERISASDLTRRLLGSRVGVLAFSPDLGSRRGVRYGGADTHGYAAFTSIGRYPRLLPNVIAQASPAHAGETAALWHAFYQRLGQSLAVEDAFRRATEHGPSPLALYLRQRHWLTYEEVAAPKGIDIAALHAELEQSKATIARLAALPDDGSAVAQLAASYTAEVEARQRELAEQLDPWLGEGRDA
jgi:hypothetical protein